MDGHRAVVGFLGLGSMGEPMALNLVTAGVPLLVWNRSREKCDRLAKAGARVAERPAEVFDACATVILMLVDGPAIDAVLQRADPGFAASVRGKLVVNMATTSPAYSKGLEGDIVKAGGRYVEAPVSGSRKPAEAGQLVAMLAGDADDIEALHGVLAPMCRATFVCGAVPGALQMKLAVNLFLTATVTGLAESMHFAAHHDLDLSTLAAVLEAGPLASDVARVKGDKLVARDFAAQASIANVLTNVGLIAGAARKVGVSSPVLDACHALFAEAQALGFGEADMAAVICAMEHRTHVSSASHSRARAESGRGIEMFPVGARPTRRGDPDQFTGVVWRDVIVTAPPPCHVRAGYARFEPRARTPWHTHPLGQTLCILSGTGWVQGWEGRGYKVRGGDVVWIPPGEKHWHGAAAASTMTYIAIQESDARDIHVEWLEHVSDAQYDAAFQSDGP